MPSPGYVKVGHSPELYRLRAMEILQLRMRNHTLDTIAKTMGVSVDTVRRSLEYATREGLTKQYESDLISKLVPKALTVLEEALDKTSDVKVAMHIVDKMVKLGERFAKGEHVERAQGLQEYVAGLKFGGQPKPINGKVIPHDLEQLPPADEIVGEPHLQSGDWEGTLDREFDEAGAAGVGAAVDEILLSALPTVAPEPPSGTPN